MAANNYAWLRCASVGLTLALIGCVPAKPVSTGECFRRAEDGGNVLLKIEATQITVFETLPNGERVAPESAPGRRTEQGFRYVSGTELRIDNETLTWPADSMLPNAKFQACDCPTE